MAEKIVVFGSGATGRGHVGLLAWQAGFEMVFVDKKADLVDALRRQGRYTVRLYGRDVAVHGDRRIFRPSKGRKTSQSPACERLCRDVQEIVVSGYRVHHSLDREAIANEIRDASLVLTAVFDQNLSDVAQTIALGVSACARTQRTTSLNCIACENMMDSSTTLGKHVRELLGGKDRAWCDEYVGLPDCMISRVVPRPEPDPLVIIAEDYNEWTARAEAFRGEKPAALSALELVDNQSARLERKLFIHNGGHAICGYIGFHRGHRFIHEAVADPEVARHVLGALDESGEIVRRKWGFSAESIDRYKQDLCRRGAVPEMRDEILRVVRDPIRKLSPRDRLVAPAMLAVEYGLPRLWIIKGIVAALRYCHQDDPQSVILSDQLAGQGLAGVLESVCRIAPRTPLVAEIEHAWQQWRR